MARGRVLLPAPDTKERLQWLVNLRWIAAFALAATLGFSRWVLDLALPYRALLGGNAALALLNALYLWYFRRIDFGATGPDLRRRTGLLTRAQILLDLTLLTYLLHFSGGFENPFVLFFFFHMAIASILLSNRDAYLAATFSVLAMGTTATAERLGFVTHHHLSRLHPQELYFAGTLYLPAMLASFTATLYIVVYMSTSIVNRLRAREEDLRAANRKLEERDRVQSQYVLTVTHDLRGSLGAIQSCLRVVLDGITGVIPDRAQAMAARAERRTRFLLQFVDELLYLSTIRVDGLAQREPTDLAAVIETLRPALARDLEARGIELTVEKRACEGVVPGDALALERLMRVLLENGIRYGRSGGRIAVAIEEESGSGGVRLSVRDDGIGIPRAELPRVFQDFFSGSNSESIEPPGTGLGLPIAREIVRAHGGSIRVESREGEGTTVVASLPAGAPSDHE
jgi:signal transduction histidine kinase